jgi:hypothetical protein
MWAVDQDGRAYLSNYTEMQRVIGTYGDGLLILDGDGIKLIGVHADTEWQYDLNGSAVNESFIGSKRYDNDREQSCDHCNLQGKDVFNHGGHVRNGGCWTIGRIKEKVPRSRYEMVPVFVGNKDVWP